MVRKVKVAKAIRIFTFYTRKVSFFYKKIKKNDFMYIKMSIYIYIFRFYFLF